MKRWLQMALEYEQLAESMVSVSPIPPSTPRVQTVQMQQQGVQQKTKEED
jgi:hypothetical protein